MDIKKQLSTPPILREVVIDEKCITIRVDLPDEIRDYCKNKHPHITYALNNAPAVYSNELLDSNIKHTTIINKEITIVCNTKN